MFFVFSGEDREMCYSFIFQENLKICFLSQTDNKNFSSILRTDFLISKNNPDQCFPLRTQLQSSRATGFRGVRAPAANSPTIRTSTTPAISRRWHTFLEVRV